MPAKDPVDRAIEYGLQLRGAEYGWWRGGEIPSGPPAYAATGDAPSPAYVRKHGIFCAGVMNAQRRFLGLDPPMRSDGAGGRGGTGAYIGFWWQGKWYPGVFFEAAEKIDKRKDYPAGTLLCRVYRSVKDQGHVQIVLGNGHILESTSTGYPSKSPGCISTNTLANVQRNGYMQYAVAPEVWLG